MARLSSLVVLSALAVTFASPALAKISVQGAENLCKTEVSTKNPDAKSVKVDKDSTKASGGTFVYLFKVKKADDSSVKVTCTVDRSTETVASVAAAS